MRAMWGKVLEKSTSPTFMLRFHATATLLWFCLIWPSVTWWSESIKWVVLMSVWANLAGHWSGFQAAHAERRIERDNDVAEVMEKMCDLHDEIAALREELRRRNTN